MTNDLREVMLFPGQRISLSLLKESLVTVRMINILIRILMLTNMETNV